MRWEMLWREEEERMEGGGYDRRAGRLSSSTRCRKGWAAWGLVGMEWWMGL